MEITTIIIATRSGSEIGIIGLFVIHSFVVNAMGINEKIVNTLTMSHFIHAEIPLHSAAVKTKHARNITLLFTSFQNDILDIFILSVLIKV